MFPPAAPGVALVLLRLSVAAALWSTQPLDPLVSARVELFVGLIVLTACICFGVLTPVGAVLCVAWQFVSSFSTSEAESLSTVVAIATAAALALLGPGAYSIDAALFGRRVVVVTRQKDADSG